ncbi:hypothetical protein AVEN_266442-1 [Araneus ventricosus]|uniref:Uncharacterized protein n=1 Tax=Araneus ventricosus TaxID=182803 RepID=A0A4Y2G8J4_ARAVE|nr:hypothetical protein AVEN_266442-1 [Araneus ventricosus]
MTKRDHWMSIKLDIHHRSNPSGGLLSRPVPFSAHKIWWAIHMSDCANWKHITYWLSDPQSYCASSSLRFQNGSPCPDFPRMTPTHTTPPPFCGFRFYERGSVPLADYRISVLWPSAPKNYQTE